MKKPIFLRKKQEQEFVNNTNTDDKKTVNVTDKDEETKQLKDLAEKQKEIIAAKFASGFSKRPLKFVKPSEEKEEEQKQSADNEKEEEGKVLTIKPPPKFDSQGGLMSFSEYLKSANNGEGGHISNKPVFEPTVATENLRKSIMDFLAAIKEKGKLNIKVKMEEPPENE